MEINAQMNIHITEGTHAINDGPGETPLSPGPQVSCAALGRETWQEAGRRGRRCFRERHN